MRKPVLPYANNKDADQPAKDPSFLHADCEDPDQTGRMPRLIWLRWAHTHFVGFVMSRLINVRSLYCMSRIMRKPVLPYANNKDADQPAHPRSLISAFVVRCLDSIIPKLATAKISRL